MSPCGPNPPKKITGNHRLGWSSTPPVVVVLGDLLSPYAVIHHPMYAWNLLMVSGYLRHPFLARLFAGPIPAQSALRRGSPSSRWRRMRQGRRRQRCPFQAKEHMVASPVCPVSGSAPRRFRFIRSPCRVSRSGRLVQRANRRYVRSSSPPLPVAGHARRSHAGISLRKY
jgi:hypothetical protein